MAKEGTLAEKALRCRKAEKLLALIRDELSHGQYIYRGIPKKHKWPKNTDTKDDDTTDTDISSIIFREYREQNDEPSEFFDGDRRPVDIEHSIVSKARTHFPDSTTNREILTNIRHFGGLTTLIDFSRDLMVALFFACYGDLDKNGQLIAYKVHDEEKDSKHPYFKKQFIAKNRRPQKIELVEPAITTPTSSTRVITQKSIFVHAPDGFIPPEKCTIFPIRKKLKTEMLVHLRRFHYIDQKTIYNDMHGFIDLEDRFAKARGHAYAGNVLFRQKKYKDVIIECTKAIGHKPDFARAYHNRGVAKNKLNQFDEAIKDFDEAIRFKPNYAKAYHNRGLTLKKLGEHEQARKDIAKAKDLGFKPKTPPPNPQKGPALK